MAINLRSRAIIEGLAGVVSLTVLLASLDFDDAFGVTIILLFILIWKTAFKAAADGFDSVPVEPRASKLSLTSGKSSIHAVFPAFGPELQVTLINPLFDTHDHV